MREYIATSEELDKEWEKDKVDYEKDSKILEEFYDAANKKDTDKLKEKIKIIETLPFFKVKGVRIKGDDTLLSPYYYSRPCKAEALDRRELVLTKTNEKIHPYLVRFFDVAVRENMTEEGQLRDFQSNVPAMPAYDGNYEIALWLKEYAKTSVLLEEQGKEICVPKTFEEYPFLKQFLDKEVENVRKDTKFLEHAKEAEKLVSFCQRLEEVRERLESRTVSGTVVADKIAEDMISGKEKRTITRDVGKELSDKIKNEYVLNKKQNE